MKALSKSLFSHLKPIFHCDAKPFALGTFASSNAKYTNVLVSFALGNANFSHHPTQNPNASQWNIGWVGYQTQISFVGHVHFMFFVLISFAFGTQRKPSFQWNMGLRVSLSKRLRCILEPFLRIASTFSLKYKGPSYFSVFFISPEWHLGKVFQP